jgi:hypothetical protein
MNVPSSCCTCYPFVHWSQQKTCSGYISLVVASTELLDHGSVPSPNATAPVPKLSRERLDSLRCELLERREVLHEFCPMTENRFTAFILSQQATAIEVSSS